MRLPATWAGAWPPVRRALPFVAVVALITLLTTLSAVTVRGDRLSPDARQNLALTLHLRADGAFSLDGTTPTYAREPLPIAITAAFMALFTDVPKTISADQLAGDRHLIGQVVRVNLIYEVVLFLALWWLSWRLTRSHVVAALAILGTYTFLFQSWSNVRGLLTETPAALAVALAAGAAVWSVQTRRLTAAILTGVALGAVALTKAAGLYPALVAIPLLAAIPLLPRWSAGPASSAPTQFDSPSPAPDDSPPPEHAPTPESGPMMPDAASPTGSAAPSANPAPPSSSPPLLELESTSRPVMSASQRRALMTFAAMALAFAATITPWMVRNSVRFDNFAIAERSGGVLLVRAVKDGMTADEFKGAFYAYAPSSVRKAVFQGLLGFRDADLKPGGRYERLSRFQPGDAEAAAAGDVDRAISFFGMAGAMQVQIGREAAADGIPNSQVDRLVRKKAMTMILDHPGKHLLMTLPFAWRGLWAFANDYKLIVAVCDLIAFLTFLAFPVVAWWRRRSDWLAFSLFGVGLFWFYALLTHFISRYSEPLIPLTVVSVLVVAHDVALRAVRWRTAT